MNQGSRIEPPGIVVPRPVGSMRPCQYHRQFQLAAAGPGLASSDLALLGFALIFDLISWVGSPGLG